jgi:drug/metabolite transporter (DMT)-like permease
MSKVFFVQKEICGESTFQRFQSKGILWMILSLGCFFVNSMCIKALCLKGNVSPWGLLAMRSLTGIGIGLLFFRNEIDLKRSFFHKLFFWRGFFGAIGTISYYFALKWLGVGKATLLSNTWVIWASLLAVWMIGERLTLRLAVSLALSMVGVGCLVKEIHGFVFFSGVEEVLCLLGAVIAGLTVVFIRKLAMTEKSINIYASQCLYTGLTSLPFWLTLEGVTASGVLLGLGLGILASFGQIAMTEGFRYLSVSVGGGMQLLLPLILSVGGVCVFDELFTWVQGFGGGLILLGCYLSLKGQKDEG